MAKLAGMQVHLEKCTWVHRNLGLSLSGSLVLPGAAVVVETSSAGGGRGTRGVTERTLPSRREEQTTGESRQGNTATAEKRQKTKVMLLLLRHCKD